MKTYNSNDYRHILRGSEAYLNKGVELTKDIVMPIKFGFSDQLLYQIGEASIINDVESLNNLIGFARQISKELEGCSNK